MFSKYARITTPKSFVVYLNIFIVFKYLCNRANIRANGVFVQLYIILDMAQVTNCNNFKTLQALVLRGSYKTQNRTKTEPIGFMLISHKF